MLYSRKEKQVLHGNFLWYASSDGDYMEYRYHAIAGLHTMDMDM